MSRVAAVLVSLRLLLLPGLGAAQSADEILQTAIERYEARVADVENYTLVQEMNGTPMPFYHEKEMRDGHPVFVRVDAIGLAERRSGFSLGQAQQLMTLAAGEAGLQSVMGALEASSRGQLAGLMGNLGQELPAGAGADPADPFAAFDAGTFKEALTKAATDAGMDLLLTAVGGATGAQVAVLLDAVRSSDGFGSLAKNLVGALPRLAGGGLPGMSGLPGGGGPPGAGMGGMGPLAGGSMGPMGASMGGSPESMALSAAASMGANMLIGAGSRAVKGLFSGDDEPETDTYTMLSRLQGRTRLAGAETVDGAEVWVLEVDDPGELGLDEDGGFEPSSLTFHLDRRMYVPRRVVMAGTVEVEGERRPVTAVTRLEDYREVDGILHPFRTVTAMEGLGETLSDEEREEMAERRAEMEEQMAEMEERMAEMEEQLDQLPPAQRRMIEEQMKNMPAMQQQAMEGMDAMASGGTMEMVVRVTEIRVNEGPPDDLLGPGR